MDLFAANLAEVDSYNSCDTEVVSACHTCLLRRACRSEFCTLHQPDWLLLEEFMENRH